MKLTPNALASGGPGFTFTPPSPDTAFLPGIANMGHSIANMGAGLVLLFAFVVAIFSILFIVAGALSSSSRQTHRGLKGLAISALSLIALFAVAGGGNLAIGFGKMIGT